MTSLVAALVLLAADGGVPFEWDVPGVVRAVPVGATLERDGIPMRAFAVNSKWPIDQLLDHYRKRFGDAGFFLTPIDGRLSKLKLPKVAAYDERRQLSYLVYGWSEGDGTSTLIVGSADLAHRKPPPTGGTGLPLFPGAKSALRFELEGAHALSFTAEAKSDEVIAYYRSVLPSGGWNEREPGSFVKDGRVVRVLARGKGSRLDVVVLDQPDLVP
jgi:hypothetical protein